MDEGFSLHKSKFYNYHDMHLCSFHIFIFQPHYFAHFSYQFSQNKKKYFIVTATQDTHLQTIYIPKNLGNASFLLFAQTSNSLLLSQPAQHPFA